VRLEVFVHGLGGALAHGEDDGGRAAPVSPLASAPGRLIIPASPSGINLIILNMLLRKLNYQLIFYLNRLAEDS